MPYAKIDVRGYVVFLTPAQAENAQKQGWRYLKIESMLLPGVVYLDAPGYTNVHGPKMRIMQCDPLESGILTRVNDCYHPDNTAMVEEIKNHWNWKIPVPPIQFMSVTVWGYYHEGLNMVFMREPVAPMASPMAAPAVTPVASPIVEPAVTPVAVQPQSPGPLPRLYEQVFVRDPSAVLSSVGMNPRAESFTPTQSTPSPVRFAPVNPSPIVQQLVLTNTPPPMVGDYPAVMGMGLKKQPNVTDNIRGIWEQKPEPVSTPIFSPIPFVKPVVCQSQSMVQQPDPRQHKPIGVQRTPLKENNHRHHAGMYA